MAARTLYRMIDLAQIPAYRFGRVIRLRDAEVDAFIDSACIEPGTLAHLWDNADGRPLDIAGDHETDPRGDDSGRNLAT